MKPSLLIAEPEDFTPAVLESLRGWAEVTLGPIPQGAIHAAMELHDIVWIRLGHRIGPASIPASPRCRIVAVPVTGLDHIDLTTCAQRGIAVVSLKGETEFLRTVTATAEHTIGLLLALIRHIPSAHGSVLGGAWNRDLFRGRELHGRTAGIIGVGRLGQMVAAYLTAFGMKVIGYDVRKDLATGHVEYLPCLNELLRASDVVSLHVPYTSETRHLLRAENFKEMRRDAVLINTSRGGVIDDDALLQALVGNVIAGAALDVIDGEPDVGIDHPLVRHARTHPNLLLTPHLGGNTSDSFSKTEAFIAKRVRETWLGIHPCQDTRATFQS